MFLEYDWTFNVWRVRFGDRFISWRGEQSFASKQDAIEALRAGGCQLTQKTDSRTWRIEVVS
jgi:hypothetical protein